MEQFINKLKIALQKPLPGQDAQYIMAPSHRERINIEVLKVEQYKPSAVMILFCTDLNDQLFIPLIERMPYNGAHSAQISLPGGKPERADKDLLQTALRECYEEIGVKEIEVIGELTRLFIPVSSFLVQPYVGICKLKNPTMINQQREVKSILKLSLNSFLDGETIKSGTISLLNNMEIKTPYFEVESHKVWGATAMILSELKELIKTIS